MSGSTSLLVDGFTATAVVAGLAAVGVAVGPRSRIHVAESGEPLSRLVLDPRHARGKSPQKRHPR